MLRLTRLVAATAVTLGAVALLDACSDDRAPDDARGDGALAARTFEAGEVTVKLTPDRIDAEGATFDVVLDTHSVELDLDVAAHARLVVDGTPWTGATWTGAGPGGHHREGSLRFTAAGASAGTVELVIDGLPAPVRAAWNLESR